MIVKPPLSRRHLLRGTFGAAVALPLLEAMLPRRAHGASVRRKRFVVMYSSTGHPMHFWAPRGTGTAYTPGPIHEPLMKHRQRLLLLSGVDMMSTNDQGRANAHARGMAHMLTATTFTPTGGGNDPEGYAGGPSIDQVIAQGIAAAAGAPPIRALACGVQANSTYWRSGPKARMSYTGPRQPVTPEDAPRAVYQRLFSGGTGGRLGSAEVKALLDRRKSALDMALGDLARLEARVGAADRERLERHAAGIRELERQLEALQGSSGATCAAPARGPIDAASGYPGLARAHVELIALALACDLTRVASLQFGSAESAVTHSWAGVTGGRGYPSYHHGISHESDSNGAAQEDYKRVSVWHAAQLALLVDRLAAVNEPGGGALADATTVLWCSEVSRGNVHSYRNMPFALVGSAGGALRVGQHVTFSRAVSHNDLFLTLLAAFGQPATRFGLAKYCTGPIGALLT